MAKRSKLPSTYDGLVRVLAPRPLRNSSDLAAATEMIDALAGRELTPDQEDYLEALSTFVEAYEGRQFDPRWRTSTPLELLHFLLEQHDMNASDLGRLLGNRTLGPAILAGKRSLSKGNIQKLAGHFHVDPGLFLQKRNPGSCTVARTGEEGPGLTKSL